MCSVFCCVCGQAHSRGSVTVWYRSADKRWWCADEIGCWARQRAAQRDGERHAAEVAAMYRALDSVWADLEANGWRL